MSRGGAPVLIDSPLGVSTPGMGEEEGGLPLPRPSPPPRITIQGEALKLWFPLRLVENCGKSLSLSQMMFEAEKPIFRPSLVS